jgi:hypothetical protein
LNSAPRQLPRCVLASGTTGARKDYFASTRFAELMMTSSIGASW